MRRSANELESEERSRANHIADDTLQRVREVMDMVR
jgi:hypothetical protein